MRVFVTGGTGAIGGYAVPALVAAAVAAGVPRVLQESVAMVYVDSGHRWIDEKFPVEHYPIAAGNHAAEASAHRFTGSGGAGVVLRFGMFYGAGAAHSEQLMALARRRIGFRAGRPDAYVSSIHLADAADAVVSALQVDSGTYNIVDDQPVTKRHHTEVMAGAVGTRPVVTGPGRGALLLGERTTSLTRSLRVSNKRFRSASGWRPRYPSVQEGYAQMARQLDDGFDGHRPPA
ncbi:NAD-dependent epimerase [Gordonia sp. zg691]|uniref:NAD-dependent epimerase n=1 Tax=Gordonia jinghuaiqii TaxID=2758710 RepID=UPI0016625DF2|nr:NAD-dependent epimerase [Gordonia jinghuaiqii]MBD0860523.1 NAD-dependent epimerase [Gordonia jinghuaiqii]